MSTRGNIDKKFQLFNSNPNIHYHNTYDFHHTYLSYIDSSTLYFNNINHYFITNSLGQVKSRNRNMSKFEGHIRVVISSMIGRPIPTSTINMLEKDKIVSNHTSRNTYSSHSVTQYQISRRVAL